jgi:hypothetical protein
VAVRGDQHGSLGAIEEVRPPSICRIEAANASASARVPKSAISPAVPSGKPAAVTWKPNGPVGVTTYGIPQIWHGMSQLARAAVGYSRACAARAGDEGLVSPARRACSTSIAAINCAGSISLRSTGPKAICSNSDML